MSLKAERVYTLIPGDVALRLPEKDWLSFTDLVGKLFTVVESASSGNEKAVVQLEAIRRMVFADSLGVGVSVIEGLAKRKGLPRQKAHAWLWFWLTLRIKEVVEPKPGPSKRMVQPGGFINVKLREGLSGDHPLVRLAYAHYKPGKVNTVEKISFRAYLSLMEEQNVQPMEEEGLRANLKEFQFAETVDLEIWRGAVETLRMEGFDFNRVVIIEKRLNLTLG